LTQFLNNKDFKNINFTSLKLRAPRYDFVDRNFDLFDVYSKGFSLKEIAQINSLGILTKKDDFIVDMRKNDLIERLTKLKNSELSLEMLANKFGLKIKDRDKWDLSIAQNELKSNGVEDRLLQKVNYRCFDIRNTYYNEKFIARLNTRVLQHIDKGSLGLVTVRQVAGDDFNHIFVSNLKSDQCFISSKTKEGGQVLPLYLYPDDNGQKSLDGKPERVPNLDKKILKDIEKKLGLKFVAEKEDTEGTFAPIDLLDYIYAVLHSPSYREKYKEFLKIDFPRVPYPEDSEKFWELVELGGELRQIHLLEADIVEKPITTYPIDGDNMVRNRITKNDPGFVPHTDEPDLGKVVINESQYFDNVPLTAWEFYIGGYQPAQKWLKDRRDRELSIDDIKHYQKIIVALTETDRIMKEIDEIGVIELAE